MTMEYYQTIYLQDELRAYFGYVQQILMPQHSLIETLFELRNDGATQSISTYHNCGVLMGIFSEYKDSDGAIRHAVFMADNATAQDVHRLRENVVAKNRRALSYMAA